jgi:glycosyltransferase involved in cell wall biosynthesis
LVILDGDGQHVPAEIPRLVKPLLDGQADIAIGSRFMNQEHRVAVPRYRKFGIGMINRAWRIASGDVLTDTQCGFRAYTREAVNKMEIRESSMSASLEILGQAADKDLRIVEVPVSVNYEGSTSTVKPGRHGIELVNYVLRKLKEERPLLIFGGSGVVLTIVGIAFGILSVNSYFETRYLPFGPTMIAAIAIYLGTLMIFGGLILNAIQNLAARLDEKRLG